MKQISIILLLFLACSAFAQNAPATWEVKNPPYEGRNHASIFIERVELTPTSTIIGFVVDNRANDATHIAICNTFKIVARGKRLATISRTEGIRLKDVSSGFVCAEETDTRVRAGQVVRFNLIFPPIPKDVQYIDLIEYNGTESCEYDVYGVDIRRKQKTDPNKIQKTLQNPSIANKQKPILPKPKVNPPKNTEKPPVIAPKPPVETKEPVVSLEKNALSVKKQQISIDVWDNDKEDGDIISLKLNGEFVLRNLEIKKQPYTMNLTLKQGENTLVMQAENLGTKGNNTAAIKINDGVSPPKTVVLNSDMGKSEAIKINVE